MRSFIRTMTFVVAAVGTGTLANANLITNGSFESPVVPSGGEVFFNAGSSFAGWNVVGLGDVGVYQGPLVELGFSITAFDGLQALDLPGLLEESSGVEQVVATTVGTVYNLSFWVGNLVDPGGPFGTTSTVNFLLNGVQTLAATNTGGAGTTTDSWQQFMLQFTASSASTTLDFINGDSGTDGSNALDNVVLTTASATTPEPASLTVCGGGLVILALLALRARAGNRKQIGTSVQH